jgi:TPR repeat protein
MIATRLGHLVRTLTGWLDARLPPPRMADMRAAEDAWDYAQADRQPWENEPDVDGLSNILTLLREEPDKAMAGLSALAGVGSPSALNAVGESYYWGRGVPQDRAMGEEWFKLAFEARSRRGLLNYGRVLLGRRDIEGAARVFAVGARQRWGPALYWLARTEAARGGGLKTRLRRVVPLLARAAATGSPAARGHFGVLMMVGVCGLKRVRRGRKLLLDYMADIGAAGGRTRPRRTAAGETIH